MDDYYSRARGYPISYSPDDDPEVIEEMRIANAEAKRGGVDVDEDDDEGAIQDSLSEDSSGDEDGENGEDGWEDDDDDEMDDNGANQSERQKTKPKVLSCVDKVCEDATSVSLLTHIAWFSFMQLLLIFFALKSNARSSAFLFGMSVHQSIATLFPSAA